MVSGGPRLVGGVGGVACLVVGGVREEHMGGVKGGGACLGRGGWKEEHGGREVKFGEEDVSGGQVGGEI